MLADVLHLAGSSAELLFGRLAGVAGIPLALAVVLHLAKLLARARAWHNIVRSAYPAEELRYRHALGAYLAGVGVNAVLPARPGELVKLALVKQKAAGTRYRGLASTLVTESAFDTVSASAALAAGVVMGWASLGGSIASSLGPVGRHPWLAGIALLVLAAGALLARRAFGGRVRGLAAELARGFAVLGRPGRYLRTVVAWQLAALALRLGSIACFLAAFHLSVTVQTTLVVLAVQTAANLVPLTPNGAGTQQALLVLALGAGTTAAATVDFGAGAQLATAAADVALGLLSLALMTGSLHWRRLLPAKAEVAPAAAGL